ncbi:hypothetical protein AGMMS49574_29190 [Bacteroidia bacterium]|nr:hypothetical protein AGMMS49574_29190 [Bacteroidia bacterium]
MKSSYIAYIDILGTKNSSENEDFDEYLKSITNFQNELLAVVPDLEGHGKIHFFSDCAFIESENLDTMIKVLKNIRNDLFNTGLFIRGALIKGTLAAITGKETEEEINNYLDISKKTLSTWKRCKQYSSEIGGALFLNKDVAKAAYYESFLKASAIYVDNELAEISIKSQLVNSGFISDVNKIYI